VRLTGAQKREVIRLVEGSDLSVRQTLQELGVNRATFYAWYRRYQAQGDAGLTPKAPAARRYWNRIPPPVRQRVVDAALADPERSPRELAWLDAYDRRCAVTGKRTEPVLDAAHIQPYLGPRSNHVRNGLVPSKEFHTLFDLGYVTVDAGYRVHVSPRLRADWRNGNVITKSL
jgi:transposase-like protein